MPSSSDSDSDDSILKQSAFQQRPNRREALTKQKQDEYLIQMVNNRRAQTEKNLTLQKMDLESKQRDLERESRRQDRTTSNQIPSSMAERSSSPVHPIISRRDDVLGDNDQHRKETLSCVCPTHPTLYQLSPHLPPTKPHALECLDRLVVGCNDEALRNNDWKPLLVHHLQHDTLDLGRSVIRNQITKCHDGVPIFFWHWLLMMACHVHLPMSSRGAYLQLMDLMDQPQNERKFHVRDMVEHWKVYFGMPMEGTTSKAHHIDDSKDAPCTTELLEVRSTGTGRDAVGRFLAIWDKLFTRGLVVDRGDEDCEDLSKLVVFLVVAGTDPLLQDNRALLRRVMNHVLGRIPCSKLEYSLIVAAPAHWSLEQYAAGWVHLCEAAPKTWRFQLCRMFLVRALAPGFLEDDDPQEVAPRWKFSPPSDQLLKVAYMALVKLKPIVQEGEQGSLCLSVLEIAIICLGHGLKDFEGDKSLLHHYFDDLLLVADDLYSLSQPYVLSHDEFQHLNYYLLCFKQFVRLEKPLRGPQQGTLDMFVVSTTGVGK